MRLQAGATAPEARDGRGRGGQCRRDGVRCRSRRYLIVTLDASHGRTLATLAASRQAGGVPAPCPDVARPSTISRRSSRCSPRGDGICVMVRAGRKRCIRARQVPGRGAPLTAERGALFMCDEIQCGMYRCGTYPFGFQHFGIAPDVVTIAKGIASGFPMGMCAARAQVAASFDPGDHGSTFGGSCLAVAAAEATVRALAAEDAAGNAERTGAYLREKLTALPQVEEVRGLGLMVACDLAEGVSAPDVVLAGLDEACCQLHRPRTLRFLPPLVCSKEDVDVLVQKLAALLS
ncbi:MAG: aminotransferase class III-fold pyridoxal phosphate-dependent enzyme [Eggerthella lenta]